MFKFFIFLACTFAAGYGLPAAGPGTYCGHTPIEVYKCLNLPNVIEHGVSIKCSDPTVAEQDKMTCLFRESKWISGSNVDFGKIAAHFDRFAKDHPAWSPAVQHLKTACLVANLPPQGAYINSPAYDIMHCVLTSFIKHATPTQWMTTPECTYPRAFAESCPVCPSSCFASQIPIGSCNACLTLPQTP